MDSSRAQSKFILWLLGVFSAAALVLAIVGIYGMLAYSVAERQKELGIRLALGAGKSHIVGLVVRQGLELTVAGIVIGIGGAFVLSWVMASALAGLLYKISARDLTTFVVAPLVSLLIALFASYLPARRATGVDPNQAVRG